MLHPTQEKLLKIASDHNLGSMPLRAIGDLINEPHPQKIKHHLNQLIKKGLIEYKNSKSLIQKVGAEKDKELIVIPILGAANCGPATLYADQNIQGYLKVSSKLLRYRQGLFALRADGDSMNRADINGKNIEDGDYVIIDSKINNPNNKDYIVSVIDNVCNIKRYFEDRQNSQIVLVSESTKELPPIFIHPQEATYLVNGKVVEVIKRPRL